MGRRLGQLGRGGVRFGAYLLNDTFTTNRTAGAVDGTAAEPGPGRRVVTDTNGKLSLSGGRASFASGSGTFGNTSIWYPGVARSPGRALVALVTVTTPNVSVGWDTDNLLRPLDGVRFIAGAIMAWANGNAITVATWSAAVDYPIAVLLRSAGEFAFMRVSGNWLLLWISGAGTISPMYPCVASDSDLAVFTADYIRVPSALWLPVPLVSDGFSAWGSSDGLGHAEGVAGGLGSGGNGKAWTASVGTWGASGGVAAATALVAGRAIATVDCGKANAIISANMTVPSGTLSVVVRWTDENNFIMLRRTPTNLQLVKTVAGVSTTVSDNASTYVAGAEVRLICEGTKFRMFYNGAAVSTEQTIADAAVQTATVVGLRSGDTACTADNFVAYARGSGGEYAALDAF